MREADQPHVKNKQPPRTNTRWLLVFDPSFAAFVGDLAADLGVPGFDEVGVFDDAFFDFSDEDELVGLVGTDRLARAHDEGWDVGDPEEVTDGREDGGFAGAGDFECGLDQFAIGVGVRRQKAVGVEV